MGRGPLKGAPIATQSQNHELPRATLIADVVRRRSTLLELSNSGCLPGRAGGSPVRTRIRPRDSAMPSAAAARSIPPLGGRSH